ncbi:MAG: YggT family protein [Caldimicrobium sp.]|nr:YggT family protein [Caldimicrobium sp.]MCX7613761.1 YggT family protein [Caldimicrobium sp.]MDW8182588.1 YggT family protein [Caldimicrobium sp.]
MEQILNYTIAFFMWLVLGRATLSLFTTDLKNPIYAFFYKFTEPLYKPFRKILPFGHTIAIVITLFILRILVIKFL